MALNDDASTYDSYEETVKRLLAEVDTSLKALKDTGIVPNSSYEEYAAALSEWGNVGYSIMEEIKNGNKEQAVNEIFDDCVPTLNNLVQINQ